MEIKQNIVKRALLRRAELIYDSASMNSPSTVQRILLVLTVVFAGQGIARADLCNQKLHRVYNQNAKTPAKVYAQPNQRSLEEYISILSLDLVYLRRKDITLDVGGGWGVGHLSLTKDYGTESHVINAQDNYGDLPSDPIAQSENFLELSGKQFFYHPGFAEEVIPTLKLEGKIRLLTDLWGAYAYSPKRATLLEHYYDLLSADGEAYVLNPIGHYENSVMLPERKILFFEYLSKRYPTVFSMEYSTAKGYTSSLVMKMRRDPRIKKLDFHLKIKKVTESPGSLRIPSVLYESIER